MRNLFPLSLVTMSYTVLHYIFVALAFYASLVVVITIFQRSLLYHPDRNLSSPQSYGLPETMKPVMLSTDDGITVTSWYQPAEEGKPTIVYFHGNAGHMGDRSEKFIAFIDKGFGLLTLSYRGYGTSGGSPTEEGIYQDARAAVRYVLSQSVPETHIVIYGESLGSGVAVQMATEFQKAKALVLEAPYTSITRRASEIYFYLPVAWMLKDHFDSKSKIKSVRVPLLLFHGELDPTIPIAHGKELLEAANEPKKGIFYPHVAHTDFDEDVLAQEVNAFLQN